MTELDCAFSVEEAHRLIEEIQANPINATIPLEKLTTAFSKLVHWQTYKFREPAIYEDLLQVGYVALIDAALKFKAMRGAKFSTFAAKVIYNRIVDYLRHEHRHSTSNKYRHRLDLVVEPVKNRPGAKLTSLEELATDGSTERDAAVRVALNRLQPLLTPALDRLSERQGQAVQLYYFHGQTLTAIAARMGVTPSRVTALLKKGLQQLGANMQSTHLAA